jgi:hypothetical protein
VFHDAPLKSCAEEPIAANDGAVMATKANKQTTFFKVFFIILILSTKNFVFIDFTFSPTLIIYKANTVP